jgi:hypothetical protein
MGPSAGEREVGMPVRLRGLVRAQNQVRAMLHKGVSETEEPQFRALVHNLVRQVEHACAEAGTTPDFLPAASRNAYRFLTALGTESLPRPDPAGDGMARPPVRIRNAVVQIEHFGRRLWQQLDRLAVVREARSSMAREIGAVAGRIEEICSAAGEQPSSLEGKTRQAYCWLKLLADEECLVEHVQALLAARAAASRYFRPGSVEVRLAPMASLWRAGPVAGAMEHKFNQGFASSPAHFWDDAFRLLAAGQREEFRRRLDLQAEEEAFQATAFELEAQAEAPAQRPQGRVHDLEASFARVNAAYFGGTLPRPRLGWTRRLTSRLFGCYQGTFDRLTVSQSLDDPSVPAEVLDFIMYHELLHKLLGVPRDGNGRRRVHTPEFRARERLFAGWEQARSFLDALAAKR